MIICHWCKAWGCVTKETSAWERYFGLIDYWRKIYIWNSYKSQGQSHLSGKTIDSIFWSSSSGYLEIKYILGAYFGMWINVETIYVWQGNLKLKLGGSYFKAKLNIDGVI